METIERAECKNLTRVIAGVREWVDTSRVASQKAGLKEEGGEEQQKMEEKEQQKMEEKETL